MANKNIYEKMFHFYDEIGSFGLMVMEGFRSCYMVGVSRGSKV